MTSDNLLHLIRERHSDHTFNVQCCAKELNYSTSHLREFVNSTYNTSPQRLIETIRLEAPVHIICNNNTTIYSVCTETGYANQKTFRQAFRRRLKISPSELKKKINNAKNSQKV